MRFYNHRFLRYSSTILPRILISIGYRFLSAARSKKSTTISLPSHLPVRELASRLKKLVPNSKAKKITPKSLSAAFFQHHGKQQYSFLDSFDNEYIFPTLKSVIIPYELARNYALSQGLDVEYVEVEPRRGVVTCNNDNQPVIVLLGHVDHGKTTLLDTLRGTSVAGSEIGGITQCISACSVVLSETKYSKQNVTFIDTPGHEHFFSMRKNGSIAADLGLLLLDIDEGPRPQTVEALERSRKLQLPIVIALNKMDISTETRAVQCLEMLLDQWYKIYGIRLGLKNEKDSLMKHLGIIDHVQISAKTSSGISKLKQTLLSCSKNVLDELSTSTIESLNMTDIEQYLSVEATVLDVIRSRTQGTLVQVIIRSGCLSEGDYFVCGLLEGKVKLLLDDEGKRLYEAKPGHLVQVAGVSRKSSSYVHENPPVGAAFWVLPKSKISSLIEYRQSVVDYESRCVTERVPHTEDGDDDIERVGCVSSDHDACHDEWDCLLPDDICISVKANNAASLSTLLDVVEREMPSVQVAYTGIGEITKADIDATKELDIDTIITFNVSTKGKDEWKYAKQKNLNIRNFAILHELIFTVKKESEIEANEQLENFKEQLRNGHI